MFKWRIQDFKNRVNEFLVSDDTGEKEDLYFNEGIKSDWIRASILLRGEDVENGEGVYTIHDVTDDMSIGRDIDIQNIHSLEVAIFFIVTHSHEIAKGETVNQLPIPGVCGIEVHIKNPSYSPHFPLHNKNNNNNKILYKYEGSIRLGTFNRKFAVETQNITTNITTEYNNNIIEETIQKLKIPNVCCLSDIIEDKTLKTVDIVITFEKFIWSEDIEINKNKNKIIKIPKNENESLVTSQWINKKEKEMKRFEILKNRVSSNSNSITEFNSMNIERPLVIRFTGSIVQSSTHLIWKVNDLNKLFNKSLENNDDINLFSPIFRLERKLVKYADNIYNMKEEKEISISILLSVELVRTENMLGKMKSICDRSVILRFIEPGSNKGISLNNLTHDLNNNSIKLFGISLLSISPFIENSCSLFENKNKNKDVKYESVNITLNGFKLHSRFGKDSLILCTLQKFYRHLKNGEMILSILFDATKPTITTY